MSELTKNEAINLITPVADGEATGAERNAFFAYLKKDHHVRNLYEQELKTKMFLKKNLRRIDAPPELYHFARKVGTHANYADYPNEDCIKDLPRTNGSFSRNNYWYFSIAAILLACFLFLFGNRFNPAEISEASIVIEQQVYEHFKQLNDGTVADSIFAPTTPDLAQHKLIKELKFDIQIPDLSQASFNGYSNSEFIDGFYTPVLNYTCRENYPIYIFAFDMDNLTDEIKPDKNASEACSTKNDYHITKIDGYQVVSWKWGQTWYAAISEHQGERFAEMLPR